MKISALSNGANEKLIIIFNLLIDNDKLIFT